MKFYQIIAPVVLSIMYTATIFVGPKDTALPYIPLEICNLIGEFRGADDDFFKKIGHPIYTGSYERCYGPAHEYYYPEQPYLGTFTKSILQSLVVTYAIAASVPMLLKLPLRWVFS